MWIHQMMRMVMCVLLNSYGHLRIRHTLDLLSSWFIEIGKTR
jgi:4-alpha-glucanotransferase